MRTRIVVSILAVAALGMAAAGIASYFVQREAVLTTIDAQLLRTVPDLKTIAAGDTSDVPPTTVSAVLQVAMKQIIPASNESVLGLIDEKPAWVPAAKLPFRINEDARFIDRIVDEAHPTKVVMGTAKSTLGTLRYLIVPVSAAGDSSTGLYVSAYNLDAELKAVADSFQTYIRVALVALALLGLAAWVVSGRLLRPIRLLREAAAASSTAADLTERIPVTGRDDVSELAAAINGMFDRLQESAASGRRLFNDVGHELKTPITIIRGHLELLDADNPADVDITRALAIDELDRMNTLVSEISLLAESTTAQFIDKTEVDIEALTLAVGAKASALDAARTWEVESVSGLALLDSGRITQAWLQLSNNAVKYSTPGAPIAIVSAVTQNRSGHWLDLSVRDSGPGIPADAQERIFERFGRLESARGAEGSGLGLSIVTAIAEAHGGSVTLASAEGTASTFTIRIPLATGSTEPGSSL